MMELLELVLDFIEPFLEKMELVVLELVLEFLAPFLETMELVQELFLEQLLQELVLELSLGFVFPFFSCLAAFSSKSAPSDQTPNFRVNHTSL